MLAEPGQGQSRLHLLCHLLPVRDLTVCGAGALLCAGVWPGSRGDGRPLGQTPGRRRSQPGHGLHPPLGAARPTEQVGRGAGRTHGWERLPSTESGVHPLCQGHEHQECRLATCHRGPLQAAALWALALAEACDLTPRLSQEWGQSPPAASDQVGWNRRGPVQCPAPHQSPSDPPVTPPLRVKPTTVSLGCLSQDPQAEAGWNRASV